MQFLRRHFEKLILSLVLAGLGAVAFWLYVAVKEVKEAKPIAYGPPPGAKPVTNLDLSPLRAALSNLTEAPALELSGEHNLFNPVTWKRKPNGDLVKMTRQGAAALTVAEIRPLYFTISLDRGSPQGFFMVSKHAFGHQTNWFGVYGRPADPLHPYPIITNTTGPGNTLVLQVRIPEDGIVVPVASNAPYKKVEAYEADLKYNASDSTNVFTKMHMGDSLWLSGELFKILAMTSNAVTVQDTRTAQKAEKQWNGGP
jgi:hypothetical protein